jgi:hypothetical protein
MMQRYVVSATRIEKNPWRYATLPGFEVLSRASDEKTKWWLDALRRGLWVENSVLPRDWLPRSPVPDTVIIDDTDLEAIPISQLRSQEIRLEAPDDALTWGRLSGKVHTWSDRFDSYDNDTYAINVDLYGVDTERAACVMGLRRVYHCAPQLPRWLFYGMMGPSCGVFRESFMPFFESEPGALVRSAEGPGTLWVSLDETQRLLALLKKDRKAKVAVPPLGTLFDEAGPPDGSEALWESEAGLFVRWGLMGPGREDPALAHAFSELVGRARRAPVTERVFAECFGFGYAAMEARLESFLREVLAQPTSVALEMPYRFPEAELKPATADQIGRILGDWLRMQGERLLGRNPEMGAEFLRASGRMLERAYRADNGFPPDVDPVRPTGPPDNPPRKVAPGQVVVMKPFVVEATHIHDPGLLAVYGLYERDAGNDGKAREFLEAAVRAGVVRPRACLALAGLRLAEATANPLGTRGRLSEAQASSVLGPLRGALGAPPASDAYALYVQVLEHRDSHADKIEVGKLADGVALFPRYTALSYHSALVCAEGGFTEQAAAMTDAGLVFANDKGSRDDLERLRLALGIRSPAGPAP